MERLLQYFDDLDDFYGTLGLLRERLRGFLLASLSCALVASVASAAAQLAPANPPIALATSTLLFVVLLYRSVTVPSRRWRPTA